MTSCFVQLLTLWDVLSNLVAFYRLSRGAQEIPPWGNYPGLPWLSSALQQCLILVAVLGHMVLLREAIQKKKISFCLVFFNFALTPPPVFWNPSRNFFQNLILYKLKFLKVFGLWLSPQIYLEKCPSKNKNVPHHLWNQVDPPPLFLKNVQSQAEKFLKSFGIR